MKNSLIALVTVIFHGAAGRQEFLPGAAIERGLMPAVDEDALLKAGAIADPELNEDAARFAALLDRRAAQEFQNARHDVQAENATLTLGMPAGSEVVLPVVGVLVGDGTGTALAPIQAEHSLVQTGAGLSASADLSAGTATADTTVTAGPMNTSASTSATALDTALSSVSASPAVAAVATAAAAPAAPDPVVATGAAARTPAAKGPRR